MYSGNTSFKLCLITCSFFHAPCSLYSLWLCLGYSPCLIHPPGSSFTAVWLCEFQVKMETWIKTGNFPFWSRTNWLRKYKNRDKAHTSTGNEPLKYQKFQEIAVGCSADESRLKKSTESGYAIHHTKKAARSLKILGGKNLKNNSFRRAKASCETEGRG